MDKSEDDKGVFIQSCSVRTDRGGDIHISFQEYVYTKELTRVDTNLEASWKEDMLKGNYHMGVNKYQRERRTLPSIYIYSFYKYCI